MDNDKDVNPHIRYSGVVHDPKKADQRIEEATGKPIAEIKAGFNDVFNKFKMDLRRTIDELRQENTKLKAENARLKSEITKSNGKSNLSRMRTARKSNK